MGIELPDIPGNSQRNKVEEKSIEVKPLALKGSVEVKKKGFGTKIGEALLPEDMEATKENIFKRIIVPSVKNLIASMIEEFLFQGSRSGRSQSTTSYLGNPSYINYADYSRNNDRDRRDRQRSISERDFNYRSLYFDYEEDARACLNDLLDMLDRYPSVSIGNLYDILGKTTTASQFNYGWSSLRDARVVLERNGGATLYLPKASPLD
ncbi:MAG: hypothetical protein J6Y02_11770 [Pseudobutyrivibrio sp.]|nr:hypothetical protein [Lachnospiraceae bacterium]MBP5596052.1 hypothetical protein [Pseudobutyrivibrio sp.]